MRKPKKTIFKKHLYSQLTSEFKLFTRDTSMCHLHSFLGLSFVDQTPQPSVTTFNEKFSLGAVPTTRV